jgi:hypothetical protein
MFNFVTSANRRKERKHVCRQIFIKIFQLDQSRILHPAAIDFFIRDFMFTSAGHKLIKILDPLVSWRGKENDSIWGADPVHPADVGYGLLADGAAVLLHC